MNQLPPFVYARAFWEALSVALAGLLGLGAYLGWFSPEWAVPSAVILTWALAFLRLFGIHPELMAQALEARLRRAEALVAEASRLRNDLRDMKAVKETAKKSK
jgi:hypothetical protein